MAGTWYFSRHKQKVGPFSWNQLRQMADLGLLQRSDHVWEDGSPRWLEASAVAGLFPREPTAKEYRVAVGGQSWGPYTAQQVRGFLMSGRLSGDTMVRTGDATKWSPLSQMAEFAQCIPVTSHSAAVLVTDQDQKISKEEAALYLAGKEGDAMARLIAKLMELKRKYANNNSLAESLDRNISELKNLREQNAPRTSLPGESQDR
jgi:uncharacterized protein DUF4339